jgi:hypothetical protein
MKWGIPANPAIGRDKEGHGLRPDPGKKHETLSEK